MSMRIMLSVCLLILFVSAAYADEQAKQPALDPVPVTTFVKKADPAAYEDSEKAAALFAKRGKILVEMYEARTKVIQRNPQAQKIKREMEELARKLAVTVENDPEMNKLNKTLAKTDEEIQSLKKKETAGK